MTYSRTFVLAHGHVMNVGDSVLRRYYLSSLAAVSGVVTVWPGRLDASYISGLVRPQDYRSGSVRPSFANSYLDWYLQVARSIPRRNVLVALNAGQYTLSRRYLLQAVTLIPLLAFARVLGNKVVWYGAAVPELKRGRTWVYSMLAALASDVRWRDSLTPIGGDKAGRMPDWAFGYPAVEPELHPRDLIVVSLRGDRPAQSARWRQSVVDLGSRTGLNLHFVSQVKEDCARAEELASTLSANCTTWQHGGHSEQEELVRSIYRRASVVISDRLHVLIMAATEGAVPLPYLETSTEKIRRHLDHLGFHWIVDDRDAVALIDGLDLGALSELSRETRDIHSAAYSELEMCQSELGG